MDITAEVAEIWASAAPWLRTHGPFPHSEVPGLLSGMGVVNTVAVFVYTTVLGRVAAVRHRRNAVITFGCAWLAVALVVAGYVLNSYLAWETGLFVDIGLLVWVASFGMALYFIRVGSRDVVGSGTRSFERITPFSDTSRTARFGVGFIDTVIDQTVKERGHVTFPVLLVHDIGSPGLRIAASYVRAGLSAHESVVYLTFSRPHSFIRQQLAAPGIPQDGLWIIDCYSMVYMPEEVANAAKRVFHADPRNPADVYKRYLQALGQCRKRSDSVRVIYETLSDFVKLADVELVAHYLRRVIVLEEKWHIRAVYLFWQGAVVNPVDATYLQWFFSSKLDLVMPDSMIQPAVFRAKFTRFFAEPLTLDVARDLELDRHALFRVNTRRVKTLADAMRRLSYVPRPYGFLPAIQGADRARHLANFVLFMAAIDHDTHRPNQKFEDVVDGRPMHGSDLLYALAERAKTADLRLFLPDAFATVSDPAVADMFTSPAGKQPADVVGRAETFRDCARRLNDEYGGDALRLVAVCNRRLGGPGGLLVRLSSFPAFSDPVGKKSALLVKLLIREGLFDPLDPGQIAVAVDHVIMTMALRSGIVLTADSAVRGAIESGTPLDAMQIGLLRDVAKEAMVQLTIDSGLRPDVIDDLIWSYGRQSLRQPIPLRIAADVHSELDNQVDPAARETFISILNGVDAVASEERFPTAQTVRGPFTRYY